MWRSAALNPNSENYYFGPLQNQMREIVWASKRLQTFGPSDWIDSINNTEMRITFENDSFIKVDGSDNVDKYRGVKLKRNGIVAYDEFKDFREDFHDAMDPNILIASLLIVGTPPEADDQYDEKGKVVVTKETHHFVKVAESFRSDKDKVYLNRPSSSNPYIMGDPEKTRQWLEDKRRELIALGKADVWMREYEAKRISGGENHLLPLFNRENNVVNHNQLMAMLRRDMKKLKHYVICDPGNATVFAVNFIVLNPYTKIAYQIGEIYETSLRETSTSKIMPRIIDKMRELSPKGGWELWRDEAALWFENEVIENFGDEYYFAPAPKNTPKNEGLSTLQDMVAYKKLILSSDCTKTIWEFTNYKRKNGKIPKENDHALDCWRYFIHVSDYSLPGQAEPMPESLQDDFRGATMEQDYERGLLDDNDGDLMISTPYD